MRGAPKNGPPAPAASPASPASLTLPARAASTVLAAWTRRLVEEAAPAAAAEGLLAELGEAPEPLDGDARVPYRAAVALWERLPEAQGDPDFGLHFAERTRVAHLGVAGYFASTAGTMGAALERVQRFHRLLKDPSELTISAGPEAIRICEAPPPGEAGFPRHLAEAILATYLVLARQWTGAPLAAAAVRFQHAAPGDTRAHHLLFGCPPVFGASVNELVLPGEAASLPLHNADATLSRYLEPVAATRLAALPEGDRLVADLERAVLGALPDGYPTIQRAARRLGLSSRSLQRRLEERSTRYQTVVDGVRHDAAVRLLADASLSVAEVAFLLGFSDTSGFHRAFRRWTGHAPRRCA